MGNAVGRPTLYTPELADEICARMAQGQSLRSICEADDMPGERTIFTWLFKHQDFRQNYTKSREYWADAEFENMFSIADNPTIGEKVKISADGSREITTGDMVERARLQIDLRKWALARMSPKKYGDRTIVQGDNDADPINIKHGLDASITGALEDIGRPKQTAGSGLSELEENGAGSAISSVRQLAHMDDPGGPGMGQDEDSM